MKNVLFIKCVDVILFIHCTVLKRMQVPVDTQKRYEENDEIM